MSLLRLVTERFWLPSYFFLTRLLACSVGSGLPCFKLSYRETQWRGVTRSFWPIRNSKLSPSSPQYTRNWILPTATQVGWEVDLPPIDTLMAALWGALSQRAQLSHTKMPDLQKLWDNECLLFEAKRSLGKFVTQPYIPHPVPLLITE